MLFAIVALIMIGWKFQLASLGIAAGAYFILRFKLSHPRPVHRAALLWLILFIGFIVLTLPLVPEHGLSF